MWVTAIWLKLLDIILTMVQYGVTETMIPSHRQWIIPFAIQLIPAALMFCGLFLIKESPRWLFSRGKHDSAVQNLCWIRNLAADDLYIVEEIDAIETALDHQRNSVGLGFWQPFKAVWNNSRCRYRFLLGGSLFFWQNPSGINAINYYSPTVFKSIGITGTSTALFTTGIFGCIKTVVTVIWLLLLIDRLGRRNLLIWGAIGGSVCLYYVGAYIRVADPSKHVRKDGGLSSGGISAMFFFYLWCTFYTPSWNGTPWVYNSEMFDQNVRTLAQAFAAANNWFWNFLVARFTPQMFTAMGYGVYFFFASLMICSAIYVWFLLPETKGVPLESMNRLFERTLTPRKAHSVVLSELQQKEAEFRRNIDSSNLHIEKNAPGTHEHIEYTKGV